MNPPPPSYKNQCIVPICKTHHIIPLCESPGGRVAQFHPDDTALHLWGWPEIVPPHLHELIDLGEELGVHAQPAVQRLPRPRRQPERELLLEHHHRALEHRAVRQELEHEHRQDLVRHVCDANVEEGCRAILDKRCANSSTGR